MEWSLSVPVVLALVLMAFAGCTGTEEIDAGADGPVDRDPHAHHGGADDDPVRSGAKAPEWAVGHHWSYSTTFGTTFSAIVSADNGATWELGTSEPDVAWFHHRDEISYLGRIQKTDLAGSQGSDTVRYFDFPLTEGKTWTTKWDGVDRTIVVASSGDTFQFEAYEGEALAVTYTYDPTVAWFTKMTFHGEGGTTFGMTLDTYGTDFAGDVVHWEAELLAENQGGGAMDLYHDTADIEPGTGELFARISVTCDDLFAHFDLALGPIGSDPMEGFIAIGMCEVLEETFVIEDPTPGPWLMRWSTFGLHADDPTNRGALSYELEIWARTLISGPLG